MDILKNNNQYYKEFEGEPEIIFQIKEQTDLNIHVWDGYIDDIMYNQPKTEEDYKYGLSHDWNCCEGPYDNKVDIDSNLYYEDLQRFKNVNFEYDETKDVYELLLKFFEYVVSNNFSVEMIVD